MGKNRILSVAINFSRVLLVLVLLLGLGFLFLLIHSGFQPGLYQNFIVTDCFKPGWGINGIQVCNDCVQEKDLLLSELNPAMKWWLAIRGLFFFFIGATMIRYILKILHSIQSLHTFYDANIRHFKSLARLGIFAFFMSSFNFLAIDGQFNWFFTFAFTPLAFTFGCLVLSEIFKEGKHLLAENNSII